MPFACAMAASIGVVMKPAIASGSAPGKLVRDGDDAVLGLRVGEHLQRAERAQPDDEDDQAHHRGEHRAADENVGEFHGGERRLFVRRRRIGCRPSAARYC